MDRYDNILSESRETPVIDLGCGLGEDTLYLLKRDCRVISCDFSQTALDKLSSLDRRVRTNCFDMRDGLPFKDGEAHVIVADLSLHYFSREDTENIILDIGRVLDRDGYLLCRLNSVNDIFYGAGDGREVEENYFDRQGHLKRFFDRDSIDQFFRDWVVTYCEEKVIYRFGRPKTAWEAVMEKGADEDIPLAGPVRLKRLRTASVNTAHSLAEVLSDEDVIRYLPFQSAPSSGAVRKFLKSILKPDSLVWLICRDCEVIGLIDLISTGHRSASLAYFLAKPLWRQGIIASALDPVIAYAFDHTGLNRITAPVVSRNEASACLLMKKGFKLAEEGKQTVNFDGEPDRVTIYERMRNDWEDNL